MLLFCYHKKEIQQKMHEKSNEQLQNQEELNHNLFKINEDSNEQQQQEEERKILNEQQQNESKSSKNTRRFK